MTDTKHTNTYYIDAESSAEKARLIQQGHFLTKKMGGLLPEQADPTRFHRILDVACGPGEWVLDLAFTYPEAEVIGVDISERMTAYARNQAQVQALENASFRVMDASQPLDFADSSFDLVNARTIAGFMPQKIWPSFVQECWRILRPGGMLRLTECDSWGVTNSFAFERLHALTMLAAKVSGLGFSPDGHTFGITPMLARLLRDAGYQHIQERAFPNNFSTGEEGHQGMYQDCMAFYKLSQPALIQRDVTTQEEVDQLYQQTLQEMQSDDFCAMAFFLTIWGEKPRA